MRWTRDMLPTPIFLGFPCGSAGKESACNAGDTGSIPGLGSFPGEGIGYQLHYSWASLVPQRVKNLPTSAGDLGSIPGLGRSPGEWNGNPLQYSCLENSLDRGAWPATVHWFTELGLTWATSTFAFIGCRKSLGLRCKCLEKWSEQTCFSKITLASYAEQTKDHLVG